MLQALEIRDFALIAALSFQPEPGFVALTGETGAGKSILIGALAQLSGDRADLTMVRTGADQAILSAVLSDDQGNPIILGRELSTNGRSLARIDGRIVPLSDLKACGQRLIAIHGQREGQRIFDETTHRPMLDGFCRDALAEPLSEYEKLRQAWLAAKKQLAAYGESPAERARRADILAHQIAEIEDIAPVPGEEEKLQEQSRLQKTLAKVYENLGAAIERLDGDDLSIVDQLRAVERQLYDGAKASKTVAQCRDRLNDATERIEATVHDLSRFFDKIDLDPEKRQALENRLDQYGKLKYKYGQSIEDILAFLAKSKAAYERLSNAEATIATLEAELARLDRALRKQAETLHAIRADASRTVATAIRDALQALDMKKVQFEISVTHHDALGWAEAIDGQDEVRFLISPNVGEPLLPLAKIASGGEAARVLLAIKSIVAEIDDIPVLVFDEIDTGLSGHTSRLVGEKLQRLGQMRHVFCVTHSAAIAAAADHHYLIEKNEQHGRTNTTLRKLEGEARVREVARLLSGQENDAATLRLAETMLQPL